MPIILNLETATEVCSVCLSKGDQVLALQETKDGFSHASKITLLIDECCKQAGMKLEQIDAVSLSSGPGSYTSLRVGTSAAKGICYALGKPMIAIDTLKSMAHEAASYFQIPALFVPMIDARRMEVYIAIYDEKNQLVEPTSARIIEATSFDYLINKDTKIYLFGSGAQKCMDVLDHAQLVYLEKACTASNLVKLAHISYINNDFEDVAYFSPKYLKAPNISRSKKKIL